MRPEAKRFLSLTVRDLQALFTLQRDSEQRCFDGIGQRRLNQARYATHGNLVFGRPPRQVTCECERGTQPNIAQALHLLNGDLLNGKITAKDGRIEKLLKAKKPVAEIVRELYLATLSRPPHADESGKAEHWITAAQSPRDGVQDLLWVLLNSREFLFNH